MAKTTTINIVIGVTVILLILLLVIFLGSKPFLGRNLAGFANMSGGSGSSEGGKFVLYYADWCPHCKSVKPEFQAFAAQPFEYGGKQVAIEMVNETEKEKMKDVQIDGYPTFLYFTPSGQQVPYNGPRNTAGWKSFLEKQL